MNRVIQMADFRAPTPIPPELRALKTWLVWRLVQMPGVKKPRKIPYYVSGAVREGSQGDHEPLVSFERAATAVAKGGYSGVGLAMLAANGIVAVDFDDCVHGDVVDPRVEAICSGTYSEISPSGNGVRAFFKGFVRDRKDTSPSTPGDFAVEFFCGAGYVTVTGAPTPDCETWGYGLADLSDAALRLYRERFGAETGGDDDDWLLGVTPRVGLTIEKAKAFLDVLDPDCGYDEWLKTGQALHHEFDAGVAALAIWKEWSRGSDEKYPGDDVLDAKWESFGRYRGSPITAAWLLKHAKVAKVAARYDAVSEWRDRIAQAESEQTLRETVCVALAKDERLDGIDREGLAQALMTRFKRLGVTLPIRSVRQLVASPESLVPTVRQRRPLTEFGNTDRMLDRFGDSLMYVPETASWYVWSGVYWRRASETEVEHYAQETVRSLVNEVNEHEQDQGEFFAFCALSQQSRMVRNMISLAAANPRVMVPAAELDKHKALLNTQNGVVDLKTGKLLAPDPAFRMTMVCQESYAPGASCKLFRDTVTEVFSGDQDLVSFFQRLIGYCVVGDPIADVMIIPHGSGSNGKSTLFGAIREVLGGYAKSASAETFVSDNMRAGAGGPREDLVRLKGARFIYVNEPDEGAELREGLVKSMTGGDTITARTAYAKASVEFEPSWVICMPTNHKPIVKGSDNGIWRRLLLVPFLRNFDKDPGVKKDEHRAARIAAEGEGLLAWIVEGAGAYMQDGLAPPQAVIQAREQYRSQMDLLAEWLEDECEIGDGLSVESQRLWNSWQEYAARNGVGSYIRSSVALGRRLDQRFPAIKGNRGVRLRSGIRLKMSDFDSDDFF